MENEKRRTDFKKCLPFQKIMKAEVVNVKGLTFVGKAESNHWMVMDGGKEFGGFEAGIKPMEAILVALGGCTGMDVVSILNKMKVNFDSFEITIDAERAKEHPKVFTKIHLTYRFKGKNLPRDKIEKAVRLSQERYCSVSAMLGKGADIDWEIEIAEE